MQHEMYTMMNPCMHCHQQWYVHSAHIIGLLVAAVMELLEVNTVVVESVVVNPVIVFVESVVPPEEDVLPGDVPKSQVLINVLDPDTYSVITWGFIIHYMNSNYPT